ncbi:MAG TPA: right-handed parallel beta-helix repeat-containing protein [Blastocatellia bacterium]|nr:right-handed parallel beta-helix repeat-containing protein [Blastocatellia bacterium]
MKKLMFNTIATLALCLLASSLARAQATRTWVSGVGDDANPCSRTAPCKTFAGAISKTATGGEINVLDPGGFGAVTITKSITISSECFEAGVLVSGTNAIVVSAPSNAVVVLRGLDFEGLGTGLSAVKILSAGAVYVEKCTINNFTNPGIDDQANASSKLSVKNTIIRNCSGAAAGGILIEPTAGTTTADIDHVACENNLFGIQSRDRVQCTITNSVAANNVNNGFVAVVLAGGTSEMNILNSSASNNGNVATNGGVKSQNAGATVRIGNSIVTNNSGGFVVAGGALLSLGNNIVSGNNGNDGAATGGGLAK